MILHRRLSYVSRMHPEIVATEVKAILGAAQVLHRRMDLSGLLAFTDRHFFQVIEGDVEAVDALMKLIREDYRHHSIRVLCDEGVTRREFPQWHAVRVESLDLPDEIEALAQGRDSGCSIASRLWARLVNDEPDTCF
jgi:hypothetical protein